MSNNMLDILKNFDRASNPVSECGMDGGVSLQASDAAQMAEILKAIAGVEAGDKPAMPPMDKPMDMPIDMPIKMKMPAPEESEEMEAYGDDMNNEPEEEYMDMDDVITSGDDLHRKKDKKAIRTAQPALESIKDRLWAALNEKKDCCNDCGNPSWRTLPEEKQKGVDGKVCWKGYKRMGTKKKGGKTVDNCVKM